MMEIQEIEALLDESYSALTQQELSSKVQILYHIIEIKKNNLRLKDFKQSLYIDVKRFIDTYIRSTDDLDYGYDIVQQDKIIHAIDALPTISQRINVLRFTKRRMSTFSIDSSWVESCIKQEEIKLNLTKGNRIWGVLQFVSFNTWVLCCIVLCCIVFYFCMLQEASNPELVCFEVTFEQFSSCKYVNILLNEIVWLLGLDDCDIKIKPLNAWAIFIQVLLCTCLVAPILTRLIKVLLDKIGIE